VRGSVEGSLLGRSGRRGLGVFRKEKEDLQSEDSRFASITSDF
jgi:hypothetical protein